MVGSAEVFFWVVSVLVPITLVGFVLVVGLIKLKFKMNRIANKYRALVESFSDLVFLLDKTGRYIDVVASEETLLVNKAEHLKGKTIFDVMPEENAREIHSVILKTLNEGPQVIKYNLDVTAGTLIFEGRTSILKSERKSQDPIVVWASRDITEQVEAEERQKQLEAQLVQAQKMEAVAVTAGGVAHDLNNLLSSIVIYPDILKSELPEDSDLNSYLDQIKAAGEQASEIVQDLVLLSKKSNKESKIIDVNALVGNFLGSSIMDMLKTDFPAVSFKYIPAHESIYINGSGIHLTKVLMNLVINAFEAMDKQGEVSMDASASTPEKIILKVSDEGRGMSPDKKNKIFDPFYSDKVALQNSGTGLGLAVVWGIVSDHKGEISVESREGQGSTFIVELPRITVDKIQRSNLNSCSEFVFKKAKFASKILVADDSADQRDLLGDVLGRLGHAVKTTPSGEQAVEVLKVEDFDLVVLDMKLGKGWDGLETYQQILKIKPDQKTVILTGYLESERTQRALELGVNEVVTKPLDYRGILELVDRSTVGPS